MLTHCNKPKVGIKPLKISYVGILFLVSLLFVAVINPYSVFLNFQFLNILTISYHTENERPTMRDLNRYVIKKYANDWEDIGIELGLKFSMLRIIARDNPQQAVVCLRETLDEWLNFNTDDATWKTLEVALTNVNRVKLGLDPVDDVYGKDV